MVLAVVLVAAALAKVRDPGRTRAGFERLGLPAPAVVGRAVPAAEVAVAVLLVVVPAWGGMVAFALLAGFTAYLAGLVRSGRQVPCACFGATSDRPIGARQLARNAVLLALAGTAALWG